MDLIDLDPQSGLGISSDNYWILTKSRMDLGESWEFAGIFRYFSPNIGGSGDPHGH
jgi:hypothetical protein